MHTQRLEIDKIERQKRILQSSTCSLQHLHSNSQSRQQKHRERKILGSLAIVMGPGKKGQIVVREGDDIPTVVRSFI